MSDKIYKYGLWIGDRDAEFDKAYKHDILVNRKRDEIVSAYRDACRDYEIEFHSYGNLIDDYKVYGSATNGYFGDVALEKLSNLGIRTAEDIGFSGDKRTLNELDEEGLFDAQDAKYYIALLIRFISLKLPGLKYAMSRESSLRDLFSSNLIIGHGLIYY